MVKIAVVKSYGNNSGDTVECFGVMELDFPTVDEAKAYFDAELIQTTDPRIKWEDDLDTLTSDDYEYVDFTFGLADNEVDVETIDAVYQH